MCGFVGIVDCNGLTADTVMLGRSRDTMYHRGPDAAGEFRDSTTYLGFRRLAILDLSPTGGQPMASEDEQVWMVLNGEIYNYLELRREMEAKGCRFRGSSDTEVALRLYIERGTDMLADLNGMFAMGIYERKARSVLLARDRLGKKPIYYWNTGHSLAFASELRALRCLPGFPTEYDPQALGLYLRLGWVPNWACIYKGVRKLPPASWLKFHIDTGRIEGPIFYWSLPPVDIEEGVPEKTWLDRIEELLWDATEIRLRSDVPIGAFLSGGVDSSLVTAAATAHQGGGLTSMTISFPQWEEDEWPIAQQTARHLGIVPVHRTLKTQGADSFPAVVGHFDEPFSDSSALPTSLVCQAAREKLTVALSGDGGDELFGGYESHVRAHQWRYLELFPASYRKWLTESVVGMTPADSRFRRFLRRMPHPVGTMGMGAKLYPFEDWIEDCVRPEFRLTIDDMAAIFTKETERWPVASSIDQAQRTDIRLYMHDDILVKVDRMSMRHSLEVRSPFLDYRMVELALRIPPALRVRGGRNKYLLRCLAARHLPRAVSEAPKRGFGVPLRKWIFESEHTRDYKDVVASPSNCFPDPLSPGGGVLLWEMAQQAPALIPALFRVMSYHWWRRGIASDTASD